MWRPGVDTDVTLLPELIELYDWGYPIVHATVPKSLAGHARRAVDVCPVLALKLRSGRPEESPGGAGRPGTRPR